MAGLKTGAEEKRDDQSRVKIRKSFRAEELEHRA